MVYITNKLFLGLISFLKFPFGIHYNKYFRLYGHMEVVKSYNNKGFRYYSRSHGVWILM